MLRISQAARGLQYGLRMNGNELAIVLTAAFAQETAKRLVGIAGNLRSGITRLDDATLLGDFISYNTGGTFGYGKCLKVQAVERGHEHWCLELPSWKSELHTRDYLQKQIQAFLTLETVFTALNVQNEALASERHPQRLEVDLNYDYRHGIASIKAELSLPATERLSFLNAHDEGYVTETLESMYRRVLPEEAVFESSEVRFSVDDAPTIKVELPDVFMVSRRESGTQGLMLATTAEDTTVLQALALLTSLAAFDEVLYDIVPPGI